MGPGGVSRSVFCEVWFGIGVFGDGDLLSQPLDVYVGVEDRVNVSVVAGVCRHSAPVGLEVDLVVGHYVVDEAREPRWVQIEPENSLSIQPAHAWVGVNKRRD